MWRIPAAAVIEKTLGAPDSVQAAQNLDFETAALLRDKIRYIDQQ